MRWLGYCLLLAGVQLVLTGGLRADDQAEAKPILDKALKAMGGEAKVARLKTAGGKFKITGTEGGNAITITADVSWNGLDQYRLDADVQAGGRNEKGVMVINKDQGWMQSNGQTKDAPKEILVAVKDAFYAVRLPQVLPALRAAEFKLSPLGEEKVSGRPAVGILVAHKDHKDARLFFDKETGLPVKSEITITGPGNQDVTLECVYSDPKEMDGVQHPTKVIMKVMGMELTLEVNEVKTQEKADESLFGKP